MGAETPAPPERAPGLAGALERLPRPLRLLVPVAALLTVAGAIVLLQRSDETALPENGAAVRTAEEGGLGPLEARAPAKGEPAPDFRLADLDGRPLRLGELRGRPVLVNFWATWCGPCRAEMPDLQAAYAAANGDFVVLAVNVEGANPDTARSLSRDFRDELGLTFPIVFDSPDADVFGQYRLRGLPDSFFVDRDGTLRDVVVGPVNKDALEKKLELIRAR